MSKHSFSRLGGILFLAGMLSAAGCAQYGGTDASGTAAAMPPVSSNSSVLPEATPGSGTALGDSAATAGMDTSATTSSAGRYGGPGISSSPNGLNMFSGSGEGRGW